MISLQIVVGKLQYAVESLRTKGISGDPVLLLQKHLHIVESADSIRRSKTQLAHLRVLHCTL
jgi:hypothetical protein